MKQKTILVTGASSGIGRATAQRFAKEGWRVIAAARRSDRLKALGCETIVLDVRDRKAVEKALGPLEVDVLVNAAGLGLGRGPAWEADLDDWDTVVDTNIKGLLYCTRMVLPAMVRRNAGYIVNIGSSVSNFAYKGSHVYGASKAFVKLFSENLRCDLLGTNVRVTNLEPGVVDTEFFQVRAKGEKVAMKIEPITPEEMAEMIFWLVHQPLNVNVNSLEVSPIKQAWGNYAP